MNIIYLGAFRFPKQDAASARVLCNAKIMRELGHQVSFISWGGNSRKEDKVNNQYQYEDFSYVNTHELRQKKESFVSKMRGYVSRGNKTLSLLQSQTHTDFIIAYNTPYHFNKKLIQFCNSHSIKIAIDVTEWYDANELGSILSPIFWLSEWNMRRTIKTFPNKIVISNFLERYYTGTNNIFLPPLIDLQDAKWKIGLDRGNIHFNSGKVFIYAGSPAKKDCLAVILKAYIIANDHRSDFHFLILGVKENEHIYQLKDSEWEKIRSYKDNFIFLGRRPQDEIPSYYRISDYSIIVRKPTRKNNAGFPTKAAESLSAGCPIITNPTSDLSSVVRDSENGFILRGFDIESVKNGLLKAMDTSTQQVEFMKQNAKNTGERYFDYRNYLSPLKNWLELMN